MQAKILSRQSWIEQHLRRYCASIWRIIHISNYDYYAYIMALRELQSRNQHLYTGGYLEIKQHTSTLTSPDARFGPTVLPEVDFLAGLACSR